LKQSEPEDFFPNNPVWQRPFIDLCEGNYLLPIPGLLLSFCAELLEGIVNQDPNLKLDYEKRRGTFLENECEALFRSAFPSAPVARGTLWTDKHEQFTYENDLALVIDSILVLVEAKAGRISEPALRGAPDRVRRTIRDLLLVPAGQSKRFADFLLRERRVCELPNRQGGTNRIDTSNVTQVIRINVTLGILGDLLSRVPLLRRAGLVPGDAEIPPTTAITDLVTVFDILPGIALKLHYLHERSRFGLAAEYMGDELDLLALYLQDGFSGQENVLGRTCLNIGTLSLLFNEYFMGRLYGETIRKPERRLSRWWREVLAKIEERQFPGWTEAAFMLLGTTYHAQLTFERSFRQVILSVRRHPSKEKQEDMAFIMDETNPRKYIIVGVAYGDVTKSERDCRLEGAAVEAFNRTRAETAVIIGMNVCGGSEPYSCLSIFHK